ncbi:PPC domain-containing protein [Singulisphaera sp. Ch08]|uniref:PPC domain-containing protein n=1 Tax=Singulisphaera sp. Ch08 TaxID=3120278 RepID=A0AAU7CE88_9BACT
MRKKTLVRFIAGMMGFWLGATSLAQLVCLPAPRLLTMLPMGGEAGTSFEVTITGENIDGENELLFSHPKITAKPKVSDAGKAVANTFVVTIAADAPQGVHDARVLSRLGISSSRAFSVSGLPEATRGKPNTSLATAWELKPNSICNAVMTSRSVDFYAFQAAKGKRFAVECAARGIDSKLNPVLIIADDKGRDLLADRRGGLLDFKAPADGNYFVKVHDLTFQGGPTHFYRLAFLEEPGTGPAPRQPSTTTVSSFSWVPDEAANLPKLTEAEPNNQQTEAQKITLPCDIDGRFYPAADVDTFEFTAKKGDVWWVEVASERLGLPTDPFVLVQRVTQDGSEEKLVDVAEFNDIPSPIKPSSNGYSYDGPVYDAGSADALGKLEIKEDGVYRLQLRDLFGGTRSEARHVYRLIIRKPAPDFALAAWALHMNLRNGDRNALSKPIALRAGATMAFEVVVVRRDGFDGAIELGMSDLPEGVSASGLKIPAGKSVGTLLISAQENAPRSFSGAKIFGRAQLDGKTVTRPGRLASMVWPVKDASQEIPNPRLVADVPVSVSGSEGAPITIAPAESKVWEAKAGDKLTIPLKVTWRSEFTGASIKLSPMGADFKGVKAIDIPLKAAGSEVVLDLAALQTPPGEYALVLYGSAVAKYRYNPEAVKRAEEEQKKAEQEAIAIAEAAKKLADEAKAAPPEKKSEAENTVKAAVGKQKSAEAAKADAAKRMKAATDAAAPVDIVDIVVAEPIRILVTPKDQK